MPALEHDEKRQLKWALYRELQRFAEQYGPVTVGELEPWALRISEMVDAFDTGRDKMLAEWKSMALDKMNRTTRPSFILGKPGGGI